MRRCGIIRPGSLLGDRSVAHYSARGARRRSRPFVARGPRPSRASREREPDQASRATARPVETRHLSKSGRGDVARRPSADAMDLVVGPRTTAEISEAVKARQKPVNDNISLEAYFTTADHVGIQVRAASTRAMSPRAGPRAFPPSRPRPPLSSSAPATHPPPSATLARTQAKIYREEDNQQELFRILMAYCSLVVETMGRHRDWRSQKHAKRCRAYEAEVLKCMDEMERIKPIINAEAEAYRMRLPEAPRVRPPPVNACVFCAGRSFA